MTEQEINDLCETFRTHVLGIDIYGVTYCVTGIEVAESGIVNSAPEFIVSSIWDSEDYSIIQELILSREQVQELINKRD